jgi:phosphoribosylaminoimidazolecarboxamide formyltransferase/IMP cyclohydrolase
VNTRRALLSVWNKEGIVPFARTLADMGWEIVSSSGTAKALAEAGIACTEVADLTGYPHLLGGRVKTLHPAIAGGILARRNLPADMADVNAHGIPLLDMVVCNLYPFEEVARSGADLAELLEHIDIGGITLLRAAAKNYLHVVVVPCPGDYETVLDELRAEGNVTSATRQRLALSAFAATSLYDATIVQGLQAELGTASGPEEPVCVLGLRAAQELRYGENPHQRATLLLPPLSDLPWEQLGGKPLSYNNILDLDAALRGSALLADTCAALVVKHTTPCGAATGKTPSEAFLRARECDPVSAFGGIVGFTRRADLATCHTLAEQFLEIVVAPDYDEEGLDLLRESRPNLRVLRWKGGRVFPVEFRSTWSGMLLQDDALPELPTPSGGEWIGTPRPDLWEDLLFGWKIAALSKSNAIAIVSGGCTLGIGRGFTSRVDAVDWAIKQAGAKSQGAVLASDAFFPFPDGVEHAAAAGIAAIIQPGGSLRDEDVAEAARKAGVSMFLSGRRTFRH